MTIYEWKICMAYEAKTDNYELTVFKRMYQAYREPDPWSCVLHSTEHTLEAHIRAEDRMKQIIGHLFR
jgi:hypothetical protein